MSRKVVILLIVLAIAVGIVAYGVWSLMKSHASQYEPYCCGVLYFGRSYTSDDPGHVYFEVLLYEHIRGDLNVYIGKIIVWGKTVTCDSYKCVYFGYRIARYMNNVTSGCLMERV